MLFATSLVMIAGGVLLERRETYAFYARGIIGGGWAILYATAYAVHELPATRIVESRLVGFAILLARRLLPSGPTCMSV